jgi:hypothetical protein
MPTVGAVSPRPERAVDQTRTIASTAPSNENVALYVMSYNFPGQFRLWLESVERANPELLASPARFLLDNSSDLDTRAGYDELSERYGFTVLRHGNLGITGGRVFCAKHFDALPQLGALYWFEDDMLLHAPGSPLCRNGLRTHVPGLCEVTRKIARREKLDFIKLSFTEYFGDHHLNWAWYHISRELRECAFPDGTFRTRIHHSGVEKEVSYIVGDVHFDNWPTYMTRRGNTQIFLTGKVPDPRGLLHSARLRVVVSRRDTGRRSSRVSNQPSPDLSLPCRRASGVLSPKRGTPERSYRYREMLKIKKSRTQHDNGRRRGQPEAITRPIQP